MNSSFTKIGTINAKSDIERASIRLAVGYEVAGWVWAFVGVPSAKKVAAAIRGLIRDTRARTSSMSTGGIRVDRTGSGSLVLFADKKLIVREASSR